MEVLPLSPIPLPTMQWTTAVPVSLRYVRTREPFAIEMKNSNISLHYFFTKLLTMQRKVFFCFVKSMRDRKEVSIRCLLLENCFRYPHVHCINKHRFLKSLLPQDCHKELYNCYKAENSSAKECLIKYKDCMAALVPTMPYYVVRITIII